MAYKLCETTFTCVGTASRWSRRSRTRSRPPDPLGNPKPVATVVNMSFGGAGDADSPSSVAAQQRGAPRRGDGRVGGQRGSGRAHARRARGRPRVIAVGACKDPGAFDNELDVLRSPSAALRRRHGLDRRTERHRSAQGAAGHPDHRQHHGRRAGRDLRLGQHYVYCGLADTPDQVPNAVSGRIALIQRGSQVDLGVTGSGAFANKVAQAAAKGAIAVLVFNNEPGELEATTAAASTIPAYGLSKANGEYLRDSLGFQSPLFDRENPATWGTLSNLPLRINRPDPSTFAPDSTAFSSRGPIANNRYVKPDITAPGENIYSATIAAGGGLDRRGTMSDPSRFISASGTSFSGPTVTGGVALLRQALLAARGQSPLLALDLRSGFAASQQLAQNAIVSVSLVRAALQNTATNLRVSDNETPLANSDPRTFVHEIGSGLMHLVQAVDARAQLGTNDANGPGGPTIRSTRTSCRVTASARTRRSRPACSTSRGA
jgi:hypothetical protein